MGGCWPILSDAHMDEVAGSDENAVYVEKEEADISKPE